MNELTHCLRRGCRGLCKMDRCVDGWGFGSCDTCGDRRFFDKRFGRKWWRSGGGC